VRIKRNSGTDRPRTLAGLIDRAFRQQTDTSRQPPLNQIAVKTLV